MRSIHFCSIGLLALACSMEAPSVPQDDAPQTEDNMNGASDNSADNGTGDNSANASGDVSEDLPLAGTGTAPTTNAPEPTGSDNPPPEGTNTAGSEDPGPDEDPMNMDPEEPLDLLPIAQPLDGLRIDDPCTGSPSTANGATCNHVMNPFHVTKEVTLAGEAGTTYDVTLRIRGVVEPTKMNGGTRPDTSTVTLNGRQYRGQPFTIGGTAGDVTYQPWRLSISNPAKDTYLNDYNLVEHTIFKIDYEVTLEMAGNAKVTLDVNDGNDHEIDNYARYSHDGIPGSQNLGQFVQISVLSVEPHSP
jgi:hypothetical protein